MRNEIQAFVNIFSTIVYLLPLFLRHSGEIVTDTIGSLSLKYCHNWYSPFPKFPRGLLAVEIYFGPFHKKVCSIPWLIKSNDRIFHKKENTSDSLPQYHDKLSIFELCYVSGFSSNNSTGAKKILARLQLLSAYLLSWGYFLLLECFGKFNKYSFSQRILPRATSKWVTCANVFSVLAYYCHQ